MCGIGDCWVWLQLWDLKFLLIDLPYLQFLSIDYCNICLHKKNPEINAFSRLNKLEVALLRPLLHKETRLHRVWLDLLGFHWLNPFARSRPNFCRNHTPGMNRDDNAPRSYCCLYLETQRHFRNTFSFFSKVNLQVISQR